MVDTKARLDELTQNRRVAKRFVSKFSHLDGKSYARNKKACEHIRQWQAETNSDLSDTMIIDSVNRVFSFRRLHDHIEDLEKSIAAIDTLDTLFLEEYVKKAKDFIAYKNTMREAFGQDYLHCVRELNALTGLNF
jgi:hypothetical protein